MIYIYDRDIIIRDIYSNSHIFYHCSFLFLSYYGDIEIYIIIYAYIYIHIYIISHMLLHYIFSLSPPPPPSSSFSIYI